MTAESAVSGDDFGAILAEARHFVRSAVAPRETEIAENDEVSDDLQSQFDALNDVQAQPAPLLRDRVAEQAHLLGALAELGYTSLAVRSMFGTNNGIAGQVLVGFGTQPPNARWLEPMATGDVVASFALTVPGAGSNPSGLRTRAVRDGDGW